MYELFSNTPDFNANISAWDTSAVTNMSYMFQGATAFDQPLVWDTSAVTTMALMFQGATAFNQPLAWDTSAVENMHGMFWGASAFNQDITGWNCDSVGIESYVFNDAIAWNAHFEFKLGGGGISPNKEKPSRWIAKTATTIPATTTYENDTSESSYAPPVLTGSYFSDEQTASLVGIVCAVVIIVILIGATCRNTSVRF